MNLIKGDNFRVKCIYTKFILTNDEHRLHRSATSPQARRKRATFSDHLHPLHLLSWDGGDWEKAGLFFIPSIGIELTIQDIHTLSESLHGLANSTVDALTTVDRELVDIREFILNNRVGLVLLFAKEHGLCKVINRASCCFGLPDRHQELAQQIDRIGEFESSEAQTEGPFDLWGWVGSYSPVTALVLRVVATFLEGLT